MSIPPWCTYPPLAPRPHDALVIGAGVAGSSAAYALANRGWSVTVIDTGGEPGSGASGNRSAVVRPMLARELDPSVRFSLKAYTFFLRHAPVSDACLHQVGVVVHTAHATAIAARLQVDAAEVDLSLHSEGSGLCLTGGGWIDPRALCRAQLAHPRVRTRFDQPIRSIAHEDDRWVAADENGPVAAAPTLIIATGHTATAASETCGFDITPTRGQVTHARATPPSQVVCGPAGYVIPDRADEVSVGATFDRTNNSSELLESDHQKNVSALRELTGTTAAQVTGGRVGIRASTSDRCPIVGGVPDFRAAAHAYRNLHHGRPDDPATPPPYHPGLFAITGFGSRGVVHAPYAGELLARLIHGDARDADLVELAPLHPIRSLVRRLKHSQTGGPPKRRPS